MYSIVEFSHILAKDFIMNSNKDLSILDATCGEGNDTYFLSKILNDHKYNHHLDAYDIQDNAINHTKEKCKEFNFIDYHLDSHENINPLNYDLIIFNLGYLPKGNKLITTKAESTLRVVKNIIESMKNKDILLIISVYIGHNEGMRESIELEKLLINLDKSCFQVYKYQSLNQVNSPYVLSIRKKHYE